MQSPKTTVGQEVGILVDAIINLKKSISSYRRPPKSMKAELDKYEDQLMKALEKADIHVLRLI
jgi:hypothetical protein